MAGDIKVTYSVLKGFKPKQGIKVTAIGKQIQLDDGAYSLKQLSELKTLLVRYHISKNDFIYSNFRPIDEIE